MKRQKITGFTLIELLIAVAIVGILAAIAYPSYQEQVRKTRRADCEGVLMSAANALERYYTANGTYTGATANTHYPNRCPVDPGTQFYTISTTTLTATTFQLDAVRTAGGPQVSDKCGTLTLTHTGAKGISGANAGLTAQDCW